MTKRFKCKITASNGHVFDVLYSSASYKKDEAMPSINNIVEVRFCEYKLALGQLREKQIWQEIDAAVKNNAYYQWEEFWKEWEAKKEVNKLEPVGAYTD